jgi:hypothetical protein
MIGADLQRTIGYSGAHKEGQGGAQGGLVLESPLLGVVDGPVAVHQHHCRREVEDAGGQHQQPANISA